MLITTILVTREIICLNQEIVMEWDQRFKGQRRHCTSDGQGECKIDGDTFSSVLASTIVQLVSGLQLMSFSRSWHPQQLWAHGNENAEGIWSRHPIHHDVQGGLC